MSGTDGTTGSFPLPFRGALRAFGALRVLGLRPGEPLLPRLVFAGGDPGEVVDALRAIRTPGAWVRTWEALARRHERAGRDAAGRGDAAGAWESLVRATAYLRIAEYLEQDPVGRARLWASLVEVSTLAGNHGLPGFRRGEALVEGVRIPYLQSVPERPGPCVVTLGGVDGVKEEFLGLFAAYARRGWACVALDLPGQGETRRLHGTTWRADAEVAVSAVLDRVLAEPGVDAGRVAVVGGSAGGYFALRTAATDRRVGSCAVVSAPVVLADVHSGAPEPVPRTMRYNLGVDDPAAAYARLGGFDATGLLHRVTCPVLHVYGGADATVAPGQGERLGAGLPGPVETLWFADGDHMCFNHLPVWEARLRAWLTERFADRGRERPAPAGAVATG